MEESSFSIEESSFLCKNRWARTTWDRRWHGRLQTNIDKVSRKKTVEMQWKIMNEMQGKSHRGALGGGRISLAVINTTADDDDQKQDAEAVGPHAIYQRCPFRMKL